MAVVGQVGSGKTSLINAMLGEMIRHQGSINTKVRVWGRYAWCGRGVAVRERNRKRKGRSERERDRERERARERERERERDGQVCV